MGLMRKLASQTALYGLGSILGRVVYWMMNPVYANVLTVGQNGDLRDLLALTLYPLILLPFGLETAFFRWAEDKRFAPQAYTNAFMTVAGFALVFGALVGLGHHWLASLLGYPGQGRIILWWGLVITMDVLSAVPMAHLRFEEKARRFAFINLTNIALLAGLNLFFFFGLKWRTVEAVFFANAIASGVRLALALLGNFPASLRVDKPTARAMRHYGFYIMLAGMGGALNEALGRNLLRRLWPEGGIWHGHHYSGEALVGIYGFIYTLGMLVALATQAFRFAVEPFFFRTAGEKGSPVTFARIFHIYTIGTLLIFLLVGTFRQELASLHLGKAWLIPPKYWAGLDVLPLVLLANVFLGAYLNLSIWFKLTKQVRYAILFTGAGALVTVLGNLIFIPHYAFMASAWSAVACYGLMVALCYYLGQKHYPIPYKIRRQLSYLGVCMIVVWLSERFAGHMPPPFIVTLCKGVLVASVLLLGYALERYMPLRWVTRQL